MRLPISTGARVLIGAAVLALAAMYVIVSAESSGTNPTAADHKDASPSASSVASPGPSSSSTVLPTTNPLASSAPGVNSRPSHVTLMALPPTNPKAWAASYSAAGSVYLDTGNGRKQESLPSSFNSFFVDPNQVRIRGQSEQGTFGPMFDCESAKCEQLQAIWLSVPTKIEGKPGTLTIGFPVKKALGWRALPQGAMVESETTNEKYILTSSRISALGWKFSVRPNPNGPGTDDFLQHATLTMRVDRASLPWTRMDFVLRATGPQAQISADWHLRKT